MEIRCFSDIDLTVQPQVPLVLHIKQLESYEDSGPLPNLAVDPEDIRVSVTYITVTVHNIGAAPARDIKVKLLVDCKPLDTKTAEFIDAPVDFIPKYYTLHFTYKSNGEKIEAVIDPDNAIEEIMEQNNRAVAADYRGDDYFEWSDIPYVA